MHEIVVDTATGQPIVRAGGLRCIDAQKGTATCLLEGRQMRFSAWLLGILAIAAVINPAMGQPLQPGDPTTLVLLVRHAEKAAAPGDDPPLAPDGVRRAEALAAAVKDARPTTILTTQLRRTIETARPAADAAGVTPQKLSISSENMSQHIASVAAAVRQHKGETLLIVGHSTTIPLIIAALGGPKLPDICEAVYDKLFVLVLGKDTNLVQARYGSPAPPTADCK